MEKGTENYKKAQIIANEIADYANTDRIYNNSFYSIAYQDLGMFLAAIMKLDCFAAQVATTVEKSMNPYSRTVARMSSKQAWVIACAAVENNIEWN